MLYQSVPVLLDYLTERREKREVGQSLRLSSVTHTLSISEK
jgi:hypothetical protein